MSSGGYGTLYRILTKEIPFFDNVQVTGNTGSGWKNVTNLLQKTFLFCNGTNQDGNFRLSGSRNNSGTLSWEIGSEFIVQANSSSYITLTDVFPFIQVYARFAVAPTGSLGIWCFGREGG